MSRRETAWLTDSLAAVDAIAGYLQAGSLNEGVVYDACRARLIEIGEAVKGIDASLPATEPSVPWREIARMRDHLTHRYFDTDHAVVQHWSMPSLHPSVRRSRASSIEQARLRSERLRPRSGVALAISGVSQNESSLCQGAGSGAGGARRGDGVVPWS